MNSETQLLAPHLPLLPDGDAIGRAEAQMLMGVQPVTFLKHHFSPGIYVREIWMPAGAIILGHEHLTDHLNIVTVGRCLVRAEGQVRIITAGPCPVTFRSSAGVRKALYIIEDTTWLTVHVNAGDCHDVPTLEARLTRKSPVFREHEEQVARDALLRARYNLPN